MPGKIAASFLRGLQPFGLLDEQTLGLFVDGLSLQIFPACAHVLRQGASPTRALYIIKEGLVRLYACTAAGREHVLDFRSAGGTFGFLSLGLMARSSPSGSRRGGRGAHAFRAHRRPAGVSSRRG